MRTFLFILMLVTTMSTPVLATGYHGPDSIVALRREVMRFFEKNQNEFPDTGPQEVTISFLINAKNELIIMDVQGDSQSACDYVRKVLSYKKVKYTQEKQLTSYSLKIQLVNDHP